MNRKYLLRGIGVGLLVSGIIVLGAYKTAGSDDKDISTATDAMVQEVDVTTEEVTTEVITEAGTEATTKEATEATTEAVKEAATEEITEATTEMITEATTEAATEEKTTEASDNESSKAGKSITVNSGMNSENISNLLEEQGLVKSASEYNTWLIENGYDAKLHVGTFEIKSGASFEDIAKILTTEGK